MGGGGSHADEKWRLQQKIALEIEIRDNLRQKEEEYKLSRQRQENLEYQLREVKKQQELERQKQQELERKREQDKKSGW